MMKTTKEQRSEWRELAEFPANKSSSDSGVRYSIGALLDLLNDVDALIAKRDALAAELADYEARTRKFASVLAEWGYDDAAKEVIAEILEGKPTPEATR